MATLKTSITLTAIVLIVFSFYEPLKAQTVDEIPMTTLEEYRYVTKGYKVQIESGLDMKKGYTLKHMGKFFVDYGAFKRENVYYFLYREGTPKPCAVMIIMVRTDTKTTNYLCLPTVYSGPEMWNAAWLDFKAAASDWPDHALAYSWNMAQMISNLSTGFTLK